MKVPDAKKDSSDKTMSSETSPEAARRAAAILEVLAGQRTATEAAAALRISLNHYYLLEKKALQGLAAACEVRPRGRQGPSLDKQVESLRSELEQCRRECLRQTALVRATQRAVGLKAVAGEAKTAAKSRRGKSKTRKRRPQVRALRAAREVRKNCSSVDADSRISQHLTTPPEGKEPPDGA